MRNEAVTKYKANAKEWGMKYMQNGYLFKENAAAYQRKLKRDIKINNARLSKKHHAIPIDREELKESY